MSIAHFFDRTVVIRRLRTKSGNKVAFQCTATADCHIQDMSRQAKAEQNILDSRAWVAYFSADDSYTPKLGDQLTDSDNGRIYKVIDITEKTYAFGVNQYIEAILTEYMSK